MGNSYNTEFLDNPYDSNMFCESELQDEEELVDASIINYNNSLDSCCCCDTQKQKLNITPNKKDMFKLKAKLSKGRKRLKQSAQPKHSADVQAKMDENLAILTDLIAAKKNIDAAPSNKYKYKKMLDNAINKFKFLVDVNVMRYSAYPNFDDLYQEGLLGLTFAIMKFNPERSKNFFKLAHWYIKTQIHRSAQKHKLMKVPFRKNSLYKFKQLNEFPTLISAGDEFNPLAIIEHQEESKSLKSIIANFDETQRAILFQFYGVDFDNTGELISTNNAIVSKMKKINNIEQSPANARSAAIDYIAKHIQLSTENVEQLLIDAESELVCCIA